MPAEHLAHPAGQPRHVLVVLEDRESTRGARASSRPRAPSASRSLRSRGRPCRVTSESSVLHIECVWSTAPAPACADDFDVEPRLRRGPPGPWVTVPAGVDFENLVGRQLALRYAAGRDGEPQRLALDDDTEIAAGAEHPAALSKRRPISARRCETSGRVTAMTGHIAMSEHRVCRLRRQRQIRATASVTRSRFSGSRPEIV